MYDEPWLVDCSNQFFYFLFFLMKKNKRGSNVATSLKYNRNSIYLLEMKDLKGIDNEKRQAFHGAWL